jgi:hypothetical protein
MFKSTNAAGVLRQIEAVLTPSSALAQFIAYHDNGNIVATWAFACRYRLESVLTKVEAKIQSRPLQMTSDLEAATAYASGLPSSSADLGLCSLMRMLHYTGQHWSRLATDLDGKSDVILKALREDHLTRGYKLDSTIKSVLKQAKEVADVPDADE